jgi:hypothetical protein
MKRTVRSYFLAMRASSRFGRATKLRQAGKNEEALKVAREALAILSHPNVMRFNPAEGSVLSCATVMVEQLADELKVQGASHGDVVDALRIIRAIGPECDLAQWIPHLERRAARGEASGA